MAPKLSIIVAILCMCALGRSQTEEQTRPNPIPEKTRACTPVEEQWWTGVREKVAQIFKADKLIETVSNESQRLREDRIEARISEHKFPIGLQSAEELELDKKIAKLEGLKQDRFKEFVASVEFGFKNNYFVPVNDTKLIILTIPLSEYTQDARTNKITGRIDVEAQFQADGHVTNARVITGLGHGLDQSAIETVNKIVFLPEIVAGHFTTTVQKISVHFSLL